MSCFAANWTLSSGYAYQEQVKIFIYKLRITESKQETGVEKLQEFYKIGVLAGIKERRFCFLI